MSTDDVELAAYVVTTRLSTYSSTVGIQGVRIGVEILVRLGSGGGDGNSGGDAAMTFRGGRGDYGRTQRCEKWRHVEGCHARGEWGKWEARPSRRPWRCFFLPELLVSECESEWA